MVAFQSEKPEVSDVDKFFKYCEILLFSTSAIMFFNSLAALLSAVLINGSLVSCQVSMIVQIKLQMIERLLQFNENPR